MGSALLGTGHGGAGLRQSDDSAFDLLARSIRGTFNVNIVATLLQDNHRGFGISDRIKLFRSKSGKQHGTVVEPLSRAGMESLDDGRRLLTYFPDERLLIDLDSPSRDVGDIEKRIELAKKNYRFQIESHSDIAGRPSVGVIATPRAGQLDIRRYYFDRETGYPLRVETISPRRKVAVVNDTKDIVYPKTLSNKVFEMHTLPGVTKVTYRRPRSLTEVEAQKLVGFVPFVPKWLPIGFHPQELQYSEGPVWKPVFVKITDGLVRANVYQWLPDGKPKKPRSDSTFGQFRGVNFLVVSDSLGPEVRQEILNAIFQSADSWEPKN
jgi:hypothetical protein